MDTKSCLPVRTECKRKRNVKQLRNCIYIVTARLNKIFDVHGSVHPNNILIYVQQDATLHSLFISGNCSTCFGWYSTRHQERKQQYIQNLVFVTLLLLSAAIVEELELVWVCCGWRTPPTAHSNSTLILHGSNIAFKCSVRTFSL
jgi:hypothetical protein